jgi:SSS family solute:Na+ symporter
MLYVTDNPLTGKEHFAGALFKWSELGFDTKSTIYTGLVALAINLVVATVVTAVARAVGVPDGQDATRETDYHVEAGDPGVRPMPADTRVPVAAAPARSGVE